MLVQINEIEIENRELLDIWADHLFSTGFWSENVVEELLATEFRVYARMEGHPEPIAFASVTPNACPEYPWREADAMWLDHLFVTEHARGLRLVEPLYQRQIAYAQRHQPRRILRVPVSDKVVQFSEKRGWRKYRDVPGMEFGAYELPLSCMS